MNLRKLWLLACAGSALAIPAGSSAGAPPQIVPQGPHEELVALMTQRRATLQRTLEIFQAQYQSGVVGAESVMRATDQLCDAELDLATTRAARIAAYETKLANARKSEDFTRRRFAAGRCSETDVLQAKADRLKAEIQLLREKNNVP